MTFRVSIMVWQVHLPPVTLASQMVASLSTVCSTLIHLLANSLGKAAENEPKVETLPRLLLTPAFSHCRVDQCMKSFSQCLHYSITLSSK